jgi:hypothetical protein
VKETVAARASSPLPRTPHGSSAGGTTSDGAASSGSAAAPSSPLRMSPAVFELIASGNVAAAVRAASPRRQATAAATVATTLLPAAPVSGRVLGKGGQEEKPATVAAGSLQAERWRLEPGVIAAELAADRAYSRHRAEAAAADDTRTRLRHARRLRREARRAAEEAERARELAQVRRQMELRRSRMARDRARGQAKLGGLRSRILEHAGLSPRGGDEQLRLRDLAEARRAAIASQDAAKHARRESDALRSLLLAQDARIRELGALAGLHAAATTASAPGLTERKAGASFQYSQPDSTGHLLRPEPETINQWGQPLLLMAEEGQADDKQHAQVSPSAQPVRAREWRGCCLTGRVMSGTSIRLTLQLVDQVHVALEAQKNGGLDGWLGVQPGQIGTRDNLSGADFAESVTAGLRKRALDMCI